MPEPNHTILRPRGPWRALAAVGALAAMLFAPPESPAQTADQEEGTFVSASAEIFTDYYFRGIRYGKEGSFQPSVQLFHQDRDYGGFGIGAWSHVPLESEREMLQENDFSAHYDLSAGPLVVSLGHIWYTSTADESPRFRRTREAYLSILLDAYLTPTFAVYRDLQRYHAWFYEFGLSQPMPRTIARRMVVITPSLLFGFSGSSGRHEDDGLVFSALGIDASLELGSCRGGPAVNFVLESDDAVKSGVWGGLRMSCGMPLLGSAS